MYVVRSLDKELELRTLAESDADLICRIRNKSLVYLHDKRRFSSEETLKWIQDTRPGWLVLYFMGVKIGYFRISNYQSSPERSIYVGADLALGYRGKGLGTRGYRLFIDYMFHIRGMDTLKLEVLPDNSRARHVYAKLGFVVDKETSDNVFMSLHKKDYYG